MSVENPSLRERIRATKPTRWVRFALVALLFTLWVIWLGSPWVFVFILLLFDIYITGYIPFTWWKKSTNKVVRSVMSWVDAIVYALVLVYFVFTFVGQNYQIPSSSLEKTLLVGDYLWVNKTAYGPRVPNTPIHFPLVQNTLPIINTKSYIEWPQWRYHRLKGLGNVERNDIVVFNFPAGDTVATKMQNPDYYTLVKLFGRRAVNTDTERFGKVIYRPVDRRENYVKRAVGLPGERLKIVDGVIYINGEPQPQPDMVQFNYFFQAVGGALTDVEWDELGVAVDDRHPVAVTPADGPQIRANGFSVSPDGSISPIYCSPLTQAMVETMEASGRIGHIMKVPADNADFLFPSGSMSVDWTRADYGEVLIPAKGITVKLDANAWQLYERVIRNYEHHVDAYMAEDVVYIDGQEASAYTFAMDYYFMMGDNRDNSLDSRYWGFVPEDHIVGRPEVILVSFDKDKGLLSGGVRWNRVFRDANTGH